MYLLCVFKICRFFKYFNSSMSDNHLAFGTTCSKRYMSAPFKYVIKSDTISNKYRGLIKINSGNRKYRYYKKVMSLIY